MNHESIPAVLLERFNRLDGCQGSWHFVFEPNSPWVRYQRHSETSRPLGQAFLVDAKPRTLQEVLYYCIHRNWRGIRLAWCSDHLDGRARWPGGYDAPAMRASNQRIVESNWSEHPALLDVDGMPGIDPRFCADDKGLELLELLEGLETYPVLDEDDTSELELERQGEAWDSWACREWRQEVCNGLAAYCPAAELEHNAFGPHTASYWADDHLEALEQQLGAAALEAKLLELFNACADSANQYWEEESDGSQYIRISHVAQALELQDLRDLTGLELLEPSQEWRREPYPWLGAEPSPLVAPLT